MPTVAGPGTYHQGTANKVTGSKVTGSVAVSPSEPVLLVNRMPIRTWSNAASLRIGPANCGVLTSPTAGT